MSFSLPAEQFHAAKQTLWNVDQSTRATGERVYSRGAVRRISRGATGAYEATVSVNGRQQVRLTFTESGRCEMECSCGKSGEHGCGHTYAALKALVSGVYRVGASAAPPGQSELQSAVSAKLGRRLKPDEQAYLTRIQRCFQQCRLNQAKTFPGWQLQELFPTLHGLGWESLKIWPGFPQNDHLFWQYLAHAALQNGGKILPFLQPVTDLALIQKEIAAMDRELSIQRWEQFLSSGLWDHAPSAPEEIELRLVLAEEGQSLEYRTSTGDEMYRDLGGQAFARLVELQQAGGLSVERKSLGLWHMFLAEWYGTRRLDLSFSSPRLQSALGNLLQQTDLDERIVRADRLPFERSAEVLDWAVDEPSHDDGDYLFRLTRPNGSPPDRIFLVLPGKQWLYISAQRIYPGPPIPHRALTVDRPMRIPAKALETTKGIAFLSHLRVSRPKRIVDKIREVPVRVELFCRLTKLNRHSKSEALYVRILADSEADGDAVAFTSGGWMPTARRRTPRHSSSGTICFVDRSSMAAVPAIIQRTDFIWDGVQQQWRMRVTRDFPEKFLEWLSSLPKHFEVHLDQDLASLTKDPVDGKVSLECTPTAVDWFDLKVNLSVADTELTPDELQVLLNARGRFVRLDQKGWRRLQFNLSDTEHERLARLGLDATDFTSEPQRLHALQLADQAASELLPADQLAHIRERVGELKTRVTPEVPSGITGILRPYQIEGFHFLAYLATNHFGGILADDMGLGKTLQALTWLAWIRSAPSFKPQPSIVVCPKSVTDNWSAEAKRFLPGLRVSVFRGSDLELLKQALESTDLLVLNYQQLRLLSDCLAAVSWHAALLDEGQYIKNPNSQTALAARNLKAKHRLVLTGTPIENRLLDLWSLMAFAMPGALGNRAHFLRVFSRPDDPFARRRLAARVRPFLLRRTKSEVATDLPDRVEEDYHCELEGIQRTLYRAELKRARLSLLKIKTQQDLNEQRFHFLTSLLRLRQICCHPALVDSGHQDAESAKLSALLDLLDPLMEEGHKVLVFSQFVSMLQILRQSLEKRDWPLFYLAGETEDRGSVVSQFQAHADSAIFLISLKAGGFGLNLTAASYVVLFDPWWNPAVENQAIDRTHRIGQASKVIAYRLLVKQSIEEKIRELQRMKSALAEGILGDESFAQKLTLDDLQFLFQDDMDEEAPG